MLHYIRFTLLRDRCVNGSTYTTHTVSKLPIQGPLWPWSYGSWIYNYLCNRCLSPLILWIPLRARCTTLF